jgi:rare lipoprotein A (peptidoglycan hydrolase)
VAAVLAALAGAGAAFALLYLSPREAAGRAVATVGDDYYANLKHRPKLVEPEAGASVVSGSYKVAEPQAGGPAAVEPKAGGAAGPPSDAQVKQDLAEVRRAAKRGSSPAFQNPSGVGAVAPFEPAGGWHTSIASVYTDYGGPLACGGRLARNQLGVAHKSAPCGALITFRYKGRTVRVPVIDRGPYIAGREWDLTGATAELLGFNGLDFIDWTA